MKEENLIWTKMIHSIKKIEVHIKEEPNPAKKKKKTLRGIIDDGERISECRCTGDDFECSKTSDQWVENCNALNPMAIGICVMTFFTHVIYQIHVRVDLIYQSECKLMVPHNGKTLLKFNL